MDTNFRTSERRSCGQTSLVFYHFTPPGSGTSFGHEPILQCHSQHLWPLTNTVLINRQFADLDEHEDAQARRCVALQRCRELIRSATRFPWWPLRIKKRQGPRTT